MWPLRKPAAAIAMIAISPAFTQRTRVDLRKRSANCPAVAEKSTNGRMRMPPLRATSSCAPMPHRLAPW